MFLGGRLHQLQIDRILRVEGGGSALQAHLTE